MPAQNKHSSSCAKCRTVNSLAYKPTKAQQIPTKLIHGLINSPTCKLINSSPHHLSNLQTHQLINSKAFNLPTCRLENSPPRQLKSLLFFYNWPQILAPFQRKSRLKSREISTISNLSRLPVCLFLRKNLHFAPFCLSSLVANSCFSNSNFPLLAPKTLLFNRHFALLSHSFHGSKGFYLYHSSGYLCFSACVQRHFSLRFAPKRTPFSIKTHCIQHQIALRFAPKCTAFCGILHYILL